jgi:hypothetical protein
MHGALFDPSTSREFKMESTDRTGHTQSFGNKQRHSTFTSNEMSNSPISNSNGKGVKNFKSPSFDKSLNNHLQKSSPKHGISNFTAITSNPHQHDLDSYVNDANLTSKKLEMRMQFTEPRRYKCSERIEVLAKPKNDYLGKDFF